MSRWLLCVTALWCASAVVCQEALPAPRFIVNLDLPSIQRWGPIVSKFQAQFAPIEQFIDELIPQSLQSLLVPLFADLDSLLPGEYPDEIRGAAAASGMELGKVVAMNLIYDFTAFCTSILAQQPNGTILHARNLDYDIPGLRNITIDVEFQRSNVTIYSCTTFAGYVGCLTGMRHGAWSFSVDQRMPANESILDNLFAAALGGQSLSLFLRTSLDQFTSFEDALPALASDPLIAPVYIIMAGVGPGEGAILTRNQTMAVDVWRLDAESGLWWILETNYDHWLPPPPDDDRRDPANKMMKAIGQSNITISGMYDVLSTPPVLNSGTKYTTQMIPATSSYYTHIRYDAPKDVPFLAGKVARF